MPETVTARPPTEIGNICIHCGLCCDGSLFDGLPVHNEDDTVYLANAGGNMFTENGKLFSRQPCNILNETRCSLYHDNRRFKACKEFQCKLFKRYLSGKISYHSALATIRDVQTRCQAIKVLSRLLCQPPEDRILVIIRDLKKRGTDDPAFRQTYAKQLLDCVVLENLLNESFCKDKDKKAELSHD